MLSSSCGAIGLSVPMLIERLVVQAHPGARTEEAQNQRMLKKMYALSI